MCRLIEKGFVMDAYRDSRFSGNCPTCGQAFSEELIDLVLAWWEEVAKLRLRDLEGEDDDLLFDEIPEFVKTAIDLESARK